MGLPERRRAGTAGLGLPGPLDERVRDRILAEARGNPLALLELPRGLTAPEMAAGFVGGDAGPCRARSSRVSSAASSPCPRILAACCSPLQPTRSVT